MNDFIDVFIKKVPVQYVVRVSQFVPCQPLEFIRLY